MVVPGFFVAWLVVNLQHTRRNSDTEPHFVIGGGGPLISLSPILSGKDNKTCLAFISFR
jgi:hypothetical protein